MEIFINKVDTAIDTIYAMLKENKDLIKDKIDERILDVINQIFNSEDDDEKHLINYFNKVKKDQKPLKGANALIWIACSAVAVLSKHQNPNLLYYMQPEFGRYMDFCIEKLEKIKSPYKKEMVVNIMKQYYINESAESEVFRKSNALLKETISIVIKKLENYESNITDLQFLKLNTIELLKIMYRDKYQDI
jgi:hypothetical protein